MHYIVYVALFVRLTGADEFIVDLFRAFIVEFFVENLFRKIDRRRKPPDEGSPSSSAGEQRRDMPKVGSSNLPWGIGTLLAAGSVV